ncbi:sensor histidine kinase KdpD [Aliikangiella sp. G2MR2-5]|uniref:sensor histidine kinase n=1 Tax=Aliikangiella sp. G2MR2-5 TaxID=2788943 RepID=UPI0018A96DD5|nr:HAMP domain-containing sensor histidine kinase [Aliikangiella sp. G2MR2-5]
MNPKTSVIRYIGINTGLLIVSLIAVYSFTISRVYNWGTFDTTHYYMSLDAERLAKYLEKHGKLPQPILADTDYYLDFSDIPQNLGKLFPRKKHKEGELLVQEVDGLVVYLLPTQSPIGDEFFYIVNIYNESLDSYEVEIDIPELLLMLAILILLIFVLLVRMLVVGIIAPIRSLTRWANSIQSSTEQNYMVALPNLKFSELTIVAERLESAIVTIKKLTKKEVNFLQSLSHELRTPITVINAALELIKMNGDFINEKQQGWLEKIQNASNNMLSTNECLLWLWKRKKVIMNKESILISRLIEECISKNKYLLRGKSVDISLEIQPELTFTAEQKLLFMVTNNLIRNAFQYTADGTIEIRASSEMLEIINPSPNSSQTRNNESIDFNFDHGYGVGLFLVNEICTQQHWSFDLTSDDKLFRASLKVRC